MQRLCWFALSVLLASTVSAQTADPPQGVALPSGERLRIYVDLLGAGYQDYAQAPLGHESQGRLGWVIVGLTGRLNDRVSFLVEINPASDSATAKPACGEKDYFYPNVPEPDGPTISCVPDGRDRVDLYRFVGLDPLTQQGAIRRAFVDLHTSSSDLGVYVGRFLVPLGFNWQEAGSWTNQDATLIQRLNAEASFGAGAYGVARRRGRVVARAEIAAFRGDARRSAEYAYQGFGNADEDTNSDLTAVGRFTVLPGGGVEVRASGRFGFTGSKVEDYRTFHLAKRRDHAAIFSAQYRIRPWLRAFGEHATYWSGLPATSARHIGLEPADIVKPGYYVGGEGTFMVRRGWQAGVNVTYEDLSRDDSLVWYLAEQSLYRAHLGARVRSTAIRVFLRAGEQVELGAYWNNLDNPLPWLSGIVPVAGAHAFQPRPEGSRKFGIVFRLRVP